MSDNLKDTAAQGIEALHLLVNERDKLRIDCEKLETRMVMAEQELHALKGAHTIAVSERDHYMRYATELVARLNNVQILINETVAAANTAAYRPSPVPKPGDMQDVADTEELRDLIQRLPQNGGSDAPRSGS
jgi:hypothetical protein